MLKVKQQQAALRVALYVMRSNGKEMPKKKEVLNFIRIKRLLVFPPDELERRNYDDVDEIWANDIAWKRKNLFGDGEIDSPERGKWRLTDRGIQWIEKKKAIWIKLSDPESAAGVLKINNYWTPYLVEWMLKIARGEDLDLRKRASPIEGQDQKHKTQDSAFTAGSGQNTVTSPP